MEKQRKAQIIIRFNDHHTFAIEEINELKLQENSVKIRLTNGVKTGLNEEIKNVEFFYVRDWFTPCSAREKRLLLRTDELAKIIGYDQSQTHSNWEHLIRNVCSELNQKINLDNLEEVFSQRKRWTKK